MFNYGLIKHYTKWTWAYVTRSKR